VVSVVIPRLRCTIHYSRVLSTLQIDSDDLLTPLPFNYLQLIRTVHFLACITENIVFIAYEVVLGNYS
jgi:hypothetical protein